MRAIRIGRTRYPGMAVPDAFTPIPGFGTPSMDQHTFDRLTRAMASGQNRRVFLRRLFGMGAATVVGGSTIQDSLAAPIFGDAPNSTVTLHEPTEPKGQPAAPQSRAAQDDVCLEPLVDTECGCLDPETQTCCQDAICTGVCTEKDGCCNVSSDLTDTTRGEVCGDECCHPHLMPTDSNYSECCDDTCCAGHCYGENLCCPVANFCPGTETNLCCGADELCCGAGTASNTCIPGGAGACCSVDDCVKEPDACYVSCEVGVCRQHFCADGAICCSDASGLPICTAGNCCTDADCGVGEACVGGHCTAVECRSDADCAQTDACLLGTCLDGACSYAPACEGECATCTDGICSTDDTLCGLCGTCDGGTCIPVECPAGFSCYPETGECLGIA